MDGSQPAQAKHHEIQHLLIVLDQFGRIFGLNRDIYYTLGQYLGYTNIFLLKLNHKKILCPEYYVPPVSRHLLLTVLISSPP